MTLSKATYSTRHKCQLGACPVPGSVAGPLKSQRIKNAAPDLQMLREKGRRGLQTQAPRAR